MTKVVREDPVSRSVREYAAGPKLIASPVVTLQLANVMPGRVAIHGLAVEETSVPMTMTVTLGLPVYLALAKIHAPEPVHPEHHALLYAIDLTANAPAEP